MFLNDRSTRTVIAVVFATIAVVIGVNYVIRREGLPDGSGWAALIFMGLAAGLWAWNWREQYAIDHPRELREPEPEDPVALAFREDVEGISEYRIEQIPDEILTLVEPATAAASPAAQPAPPSASIPDAEAVAAPGSAPVAVTPEIVAEPDSPAPNPSPPSAKIPDERPWPETNAAIDLASAGAPPARKADREIDAPPSPPRGEAPPPEPTAESTAEEAMDGEPVATRVVADATASHDSPDQADAPDTVHGTPTPPYQTGPGPDVTAEAAPAQGKAPEMEDDLTRLEGIGKYYRDALRQIGITTFAQLADASPEDITTRLKAAGLRQHPTIPTWPEQAGYAAREDWDGLNALQATLSSGRRAPK